MQTQVNSAASQVRLHKSSDYTHAGFLMRSFPPTHSKSSTKINVRFVRRRRQANSVSIWKRNRLTVEVSRTNERAARETVLVECGGRPVGRPIRAVRRSIRQVYVPVTRAVVDGQ